jgi:hypothetical protein
VLRPAVWKALSKANGCNNCLRAYLYAAHVAAVSCWCTMLMQLDAELATAQVRPWVADVTADLHPSDGPPNQIEYYGLYKGRSPQPQRTPGYIMMQSNLVVYNGEDVERAASS